MNITKIIGISVLISKGSRARELTQGLSIVLENENYFFLFKPIYGLPFSAKLFSARPAPETVPLAYGMNADDLAKELIDCIGSSRYGRQDDPKKIEGWEIRKAVVDGKPVAIALAKWV